jgi:predicted permease
MSDELAEEMALHVELRAEAYRRSGLSDEDAAIAAARQFGNRPLLQERSRDAWGFRWADETMADVRYALRQLRRAPLFAAAVIGTLALGAAGLAVVLSATNTLLLAPPAGLSDPARLVDIRSTIGRDRNASVFSYPLYRDLSQATSNVEAVMAFAPFVASVRTDSLGDQQAAGLFVSSNYFQGLGVRPLVGRLFDEAGGRSEAPLPTAVLEWKYWNDRFGRDASVLGRVIDVNGVPVTIIGVAARGFTGTSGIVHPDLFLPLSLQPSVGRLDASRLDDRDAEWLSLVGRLRPNVTTSSAATELTGRAIRGEQERDQASRVAALRLSALRRVPADAAKPIAFFLGIFLVISAIVLCIASTNVANLLLARALARRREFAVRLALGADSLRLVRQLLTESAILFLSGGVAAVVTAAVALRVLARTYITVDFAIPLDFPLDSRVVVTTLLIACVVGSVVGLVPALHAARGDVASLLRSGTRSGAQRRRTRHAFAIVQIAMSVVLLVGAGLLQRAVEEGHRVDPGFRLKDVAVAPMSLSQAGYDDGRAQQFQAAVLRQLRTVPAIADAAFASVLPLALNSRRLGIQIPGHRPPRGARSFLVPTEVVSDNFFDVLAVPLVAGRAFSPTDNDNAPRVAIVTAAFARRFWSSAALADVIGKTFMSGPSTYTIVGVARDARFRSISEPPEALLFFAAGQQPTRDGVLLIHTRANAGNVASTLEGLVRGLDPRVPAMVVRSLESTATVGLLPQIIAGTASAVLGIIGLVLAVVGLYAVIAHGVAERTHEIGVRMALGASAIGVQKMVLSESLRLVTRGLVIGLSVAVLSSRFLSSLLFDISPFDPLTFAVVAGILALMTIVGSWLPARRAVRVDPLVALRAE